MGGSVRRRLAAAAASIIVLGTSLLAGSCANPLNWALQTWGSLDMVKVQGGTMQLGNVENYIGGFTDEVPVHATTLSTFYISRYEITQQFYYAIMGVNPSYYVLANGYTDDPARPVEWVSWNDAVAFCNALSRLAGLQECYVIDDLNYTVTWDTSANGYRLPTEAEWEFAARGGTSSEGYWLSGSDSPDNIAWYDDLPAFYVTHPVGQLWGNELDLYDMTGNVWEWCWDMYDSSYYSWNTDWNDPLGPNGKVGYTYWGYSFVRRGGCIFNSYDYIRNAFRGYDADTFFAEGIGIRVARNK